MTLSGMSRQLGTEPCPPMAIHAEHVAWNLHHRVQLIHHPYMTDALRYDLHLANLANIFLVRSDPHL
jgi:hypothetical protein